MSLVGTKTESDTPPATPASLAERISAAIRKRSQIQGQLQQAKAETPEAKLSAELSASEAELNRLQNQHVTQAAHERAVRRTAMVERYRDRAVALGEALVVASTANDAMQESYDEVRGEFAAAEVPVELSHLAPWSRLSAAGGGAVIGFLQQIAKLLPARLSNAMRGRIGVFEAAERARRTDEERRTAEANRRESTARRQRFGDLESLAVPVTIESGAASYAVQR